MKVSLGFREDERARVAALYWDAFEGKLGRVLGPGRKARAYIARSLSPRQAYCARSNDGRIIGVAGFKTPDGALVEGSLADMTAAYGAWGAVWRSVALSLLVRDVENRRFLLDGLFVAEEARGQGVGSRLLEAIAREAAERGYSEIRLEVIDTNTRARDLYARRGFEVLAEMPAGPLARALGFRAATTMVRRIA